MTHTDDLSMRMGFRFVLTIRLLCPVHPLCDCHATHTDDSSFQRLNSIKVHLLGRPESFHLNLGDVSGAPYEGPRAAAGKYEQELVTGWEGRG